MQAKLADFLEMGARTGKMAFIKSNMSDGEWR